MLAIKTPLCIAWLGTSCPLCLKNVAVVDFVPGLHNAELLLLAAEAHKFSGCLLLMALQFGLCV